MRSAGINLTAENDTIYTMPLAASKRSLLWLACSWERRGVTPGGFMCHCPKPEKIKKEHMFLYLEPTHPNFTKPATAPQWVGERSITDPC